LKVPRIIGEAVRRREGGDRYQNASEVITWASFVSAMVPPL
jgi:hypothetical protein